MHSVAARGFVAGLLGLLFALLLSAAVQSLLAGSEPMLLGPFRWEAVIELI
jgi:hypothetical protein